MKQPLALLISISLSLGMLSHAGASAMKCEHVFVPTVSEIIERINLESNGFLFQKDSFQEYYQGLSWNKRRQLRHLIHSIKFEKMPSDFAVEQTAIKLSQLLFGRKENLTNYISKNQSDRQEASATALIKEKILQDGFLKTWTDYSDPASISRTSKVMDKVWKFQQSKLMNILLLPYFLPKIKDRHLPQELIFKVLRDGMKTHKDEIRVAMNAQNYIQGYNTFRRIYSPVLMSILFVVLLQDAQENYSKMVDEQVNQFVEDLRKQKEFLESKIPDAKKEEAQAAYNRVVEDFITKWGEPPTDAESAKIKSDINKALGIK